MRVLAVIKQYFPQAGFVLCNTNASTHSRTKHSADVRCRLFILKIILFLCQYPLIMVKYVTNIDEIEILPNLLGLANPKDIEKSEFEGFLMAEIILSEKLNIRTKFNIKYILNIHKLALSHLYPFAGKYRTVNMSKGGFLFPSAKFINENMKTFEKEILSLLPNKYSNKSNLITDISKVHGEFLFIHPFREGNGRTARLLANLMARKQGIKSLQFEKIKFEDYIIAVQKVSEKDYSLMENLISSII
jgi:cell filamentation protein